VVKTAGLLVLHDQPGPLPPAMRPVTRRAPYIAPTLPQLVRYVEGAGFRVLTWRDTTETVLTYLQGRREELRQGLERGTRAARHRRQRRLTMLTAYMEALGQQGSRTQASSSRGARRRLPDGTRRSVVQHLVAPISCRCTRKTRGCMQADSVDPAHLMCARMSRASAHGGVPAGVTPLCPSPIADTAQCR
jgi:hypothetical protein